MKQKPSFTESLLGTLIGFTAFLMFGYYAVQSLEEKQCLLALFEFLASALGVLIIVVNIAELRQKA